MWIDLNYSSHVFLFIFKSGSKKQLKMPKVRAEKKSRVHQDVAKQGK